MFKPAMLAAALFAAGGAASAADACREAQTQTGLATRLVQAARHEYSQFPGHRLDAQGRIWKFGAVEAEAELLFDPATGKPAAGQPDHVAWRRVWHYWTALAATEQGSAEEHQLTSYPGLLETAQTTGRPQRVTVAAMLEQLRNLDAAGSEPIRQAIVRAAVIDTPWSAAFISYVMQQGGMNATQFRFAASHANYIRQAFEGPEGYAYRACDPRTTAPKVGDLLCYSRGAKPKVGFAQWRDKMAELDGRVKSHCDLVVEVDRAAQKIETIGGNVLQSVTQRRMKLNAAGLLSRGYQAEHYKPGPACARDPSCGKDNLNVQYWGVLLQLR
ncbi:MAG TPA: DUF2272 domain-containing protein [Burkholderiaceae bacterium]